MAFSDSEIPLGLINGINTVFQVANAPNPPLSLIVNSDSSLLSPFAIGNGFTLVGNMLTLGVPPKNTLILWYRF